MTPNPISARHTVFLYTEEKRGNQLVESLIVGLFSDFSGSEKLIVIQDPHTQINFVYRIEHYSGNLDAVSMTPFTEADFNSKKSTNINGATFKLGPAEEGFKLLKGKNQWIQDKGSVLSVLLRGAATKNVGFVRPQIQRDRVDQIPQGVLVEYLPAPAAEEMDSAAEETDSAA